MKTINFEIAQKLKHIEFNIPVQNRFDKNGVLNKTGNLRFGEPINWNDKCFNDGYRNYCSAPTYDEVFNWFFTEFEIFPYIKPHFKTGYTGIISFKNNVWFDENQENYFKLRDILFLETIKLIEQEFLKEVLLFNYYEINKDNYFIFSYERNLHLNCIVKEDIRNTVSFYYTKLSEKEPTPELYLDLIDHKVGNIIHIKEPTPELIQYLYDNNYQTDKEINIDINKFPKNKFIRIHVIEKEFYVKELVNKKLLLSSENTLILLNYLNSKNIEQNLYHIGFTNKRMIMLNNCEFKNIGSYIIDIYDTSKYIQFNLKHKSFYLIDKPVEKSKEINYKSFYEIITKIKNDE